MKVPTPTAHTLAAALGLLFATAAGACGQRTLVDDFEGGLDAWEVYGTEGVFIIEAEDPQRGRALRLRPNGDVHVLLRGTEDWSGIRIEGLVRFPADEHNYLGFIYNLRQQGTRLDFGNIYIKGNGSYLQINPHRDYNVARTLYPEFNIALESPDDVRIGEWQPFAAEVVGSELHFYFNDLVTPKVTFPYLELESGPIGLQPRSVGGDVWVDDIRATEIAELSYGGPAIPDHRYDLTGLLTDWQVLGPLAATMDEAAKAPDASDGWRPFPTDARGAVVTGAVVDSHGPNSVAYFRTEIEAPSSGQGYLHLSTIDDLSIWVNGRFHWFVDRDRPAWHDIATNPDHEGQKIPIPLVEGTNQIVIRVRGGVYATGGFFATVEHP